MNPWYAKTMILLASVVMVVIRAPYGQRSRTVKIARSRKGRLEIFLLTIAWIAFFIPLFWIATPWFAFADYTLHAVLLIAGIGVVAFSLYLFHRSHADLGTNWSVTLEIRESHRLVTHGIYRHVRHPMYLALLLYGLGQAAIVPNWVAGPSYLVAMLLLFVFRVGPEEQMMRDRFAGEYDAYVAQTRRLVPILR